MRIKIKIKGQTVTPLTLKEFCKARGRTYACKANGIAVDLEKQGWAVRTGSAKNSPVAIHPDAPWPRRKWVRKQPKQA